MSPPARLTTSRNVSPGSDAVNARRIHFAVHADECRMLIDGKWNVLFREDGDDVSRLEDGVIRRRRIVDGVGQVECNQPGAQIVLVEPLDGRVIPVDLLAVPGRCETCLAALDCFILRIDLRLLIGPRLLIGSSLQVQPGLRIDSVLRIVSGLCVR